MCSMHHEGEEVEGYRGEQSAAEAVDAIAGGDPPHIFDQNPLIVDEGEALVAQDVSGECDIEEDIDLNNVVPSARIAQAEIQLTGSGVVDDRQEPGPATRVIDNFWPF